MHVDTRAIDQFQDGRIDVPNFVGIRGEDSDFGFSRIDAISGPLPPLFPNDPKPARLRCIDSTELASEPHYCASSEMPQTFVLDHVSHGCNFVASKLIGMALWA